MKPPNTRFPPFEQLGRWSLVERLGGGGNGEVWRARGEGREVAIKWLTRHDRLVRFKNEVDGMRRMHAVPGVLPILDFSLPESSTKRAPAWFATDVAVPLVDALGPRPTLVAVVTAMADIADVLAEIHSKGYSHRDIKPDNLFRCHDRWCVGDFGLISSAAMKHVTLEGEKLGPFYYIAPEMLSNAKNADGKAADVFSLAKTLWVLATQRDDPIPGIYRSSEREFQIGAHIVAARTAPLDLLVERCSSVDPMARPSMKHVAEELRAWLKVPSSPIGPMKLDLGPEWDEVASASNREQERNRRSNEAAKQQQDDKRRVQRRMDETYKQVAETLREAHFITVEGPKDGQDPRGVSGWLPGKYSRTKQSVHGLPLKVAIGLDIRVWFTTDFHRLGAPFLATLGVKLKEGSPGGSSVFEIHRHEVSFLVGGAKEEEAIAALREMIAESLGSWVEQAGKRWALIDKPPESGHVAR